MSHGMPAPWLFCEFIENVKVMRAQFSGRTCYRVFAIEYIAEQIGDVPGVQADRAERS